MLGIYGYFPHIHHGVAIVNYVLNPIRIQKTILHSLHSLNSSTIRITQKEFFRNCVKVQFEVGVADGINFDYFDEEVLKNFLKEISGRLLQIIDFLLVAKYYTKIKGKNIPLRFDYYFIRFMFQDKEIEIQISHEKGTRRLTSEDLIWILAKEIRKELKKDEKKISINLVHAL